MLRSLWLPRYSRCMRLWKFFNYERLSIAFFPRDNSPRVSWSRGTEERRESESGRYRNQYGVTRWCYCIMSGFLALSVAVVARERQVIECRRCIVSSELRMRAMLFRILYKLSWQELIRFLSLQCTLTFNARLCCSVFQCDCKEYWFSRIPSKFCFLIWELFGQNFFFPFWVFFSDFILIFTLGHWFLFTPMAFYTIRQLRSKNISF